MSTKVIKHTKPIIINNRILDLGLVISSCDINGDILIIDCKVDGYIKIVTDIVFKDVEIDRTFVYGKIDTPGTIVKYGE